jgi:TetR/AcrR family transcriptional repressor of nem operon
MALVHYDKVFREDAFANIAKTSKSPRQAIADILGMAASGPSRNGCLLVNMALERAPRDPDTESIVANAFTEIEKFFREMIRKGQDRSEISRSLIAADVAPSLLSFYLGLRVLSRGCLDTSLLTAAARHADALFLREAR